MANQYLVDYISRLLRRGYSTQYIKGVLLRNGWPENDIDELKNRISLLLHDDELRAEFSKNAREDIIRDASIEKMFQGFWECATALTSAESH